MNKSTSIFNSSKNETPIIAVGEKREHSKASEEYIDVIFRYPPNNRLKWAGSVPIVYRRTGTFAKTTGEISEVVKKAYEAMKPENLDRWVEEQKKFWDKSNKQVTRPFFEALTNFEWHCVNCQMPKNPNWARRIQDIKEFGYTIATNTKMYCENCGRNTTHLIMLALPRGSQTGYEIVSPRLKKRVLKLLNYHDLYECRTARHLLPDHKFPEIRWDDETKGKNPENITDEEIRKKFQLLNNQRNEQKREVCRECFQTGNRGTPFGINFFYSGNKNWPKDIPQTGKKAEEGCVGCGWYDLQKWREELNNFIRNNK